MKSEENKKVILKGLTFVIIIIVIPLILFLTHREFFTQFRSLEDVENYISHYGNVSALVYIVFQIFQVVICLIPGEVFQIAAGYLFGPVKGVLLAVIGCAAGQAVAFWLARFLGQGFVRLFMSEEQFNKYKDRLNSRKAYTLCFILYLIPGIPKDILCYVAGASEISFIPFLVISMIGRLPGLIGSIAMGSLVDSGQYTIAIAILVIACAVCCFGLIYKNRLQEFVDRIRDKKNNK